MSLATFTVEARTDYVDLLTGKGGGGYPVTGNNFAFNTTSDENRCYGSIMPLFEVIAGTATWAEAGIVSGATPGAITKAELSGLLSGSAKLTGQGGMVTISNTASAAGAVFDASCVFKIPLNNGGTLRINQAMASAWLESILNGTTGPGMASGGVFSIYSGTQPATADSAVSGTKLWEATLALGNYNLAASGSATMATAKAANAIASGTAAWARWQKGVLVMDGSVGTTGADFIVSSISMVSGTSYSLTAGTLTFPA